MIGVENFISGTLATVDTVIASFVTHAYQALIQANAQVITMLFTVYIMLIGYRFINHHHHFNLQEIVRHLTVMLIVYGLIMKWEVYHLLVYDVFTNEPAELAKVLINSVGKLHADTNIYSAMDAIYLAFNNVSNALLGQIGFSVNGLSFLLYGLLVFVIGMVMTAYTLLLFIYAKMMMAVLLALGPIFILCLLWDSTRGIFSTWLSTLISLALIPIITSAILMLMLSVINTTLPVLNQPVENLQLQGIVPFLGLSVTTALILSQVLRISSALAGGISIASLSAGGEIAGSAINMSGGGFLKRKLMERKAEKLDLQRSLKRREMYKNKFKGKK